MSTTTDILNLNTICRCCHTDGSFKSLSVPFIYKKQYEVYSQMLKETLNIHIEPPLIEASYSICNECVERLRDATNFKRQVLQCEKKFAEYCKNELQMAQSELSMGSQQTQIADVHIKCEIEVDGIMSECYEDVKTEIEEAVKGEPSEKINETLRKKSVKKKIKKENRNSKPAFDPSLVIEVQTQSQLTYSCKICQGSYDTMKLIKQHIIKTHLNRIYTCKDCDEEFTSVSKFTSHRRNNHKIFYCKFCPRDFKSRYRLKDHENSHTKSIIYKCDYCGKDFLYRSSLKLHIKGHLGIKRKLICDICGRGFNDMTNLRVHIETVHEKIKHFKCTFCAKSFAAKKNLVYHLRRHTGEKPFQCEKCSKSFYTRPDYNNHNCGTGVFQCKTCSKQFDKRGSLIAHYNRIHKGNKLHKCPECGKEFITSYVMKRHLLSHTGVKFFACQLCPKKFTQKAAVDRHVKRLHNPNLMDEKNQCDVCKKFVSDLERHRLRCHGDLQFKCDVCSKSYAHNSALTRHTKITHLGLYFKCELCNKQYQQKNKLVKHMENVHSLKAEPDVEESVASYTIGNKGGKSE